MKAFANPISKKGRGSFHRRASLLGATQGTVQRSYIWRSAVRSSTAARGMFPAPKGMLLPYGKRARQRFAATIHEIPSGVLAQNGEVSKETVKTWHAKKALPRSENLLLLARNIPEIQEFVLREIGYRDAPADSGSVAELIATALQLLASSEGPQADMVRAILQGSKP